MFQVLIDNTDCERAKAAGFEDLKEFGSRRMNGRQHGLAKAQATRYVQQMARQGIKASVWDCCHALAGLFSR